MEQGGTWQAFVSTGSVKTYLDYKKAQQKEKMPIQFFCCLLRSKG